jgi:hypothetical protein
MSNETAAYHRQFCDAACRTLDEGLRKIEHCVGQLSEEDVWWRPGDSLNSVANLLLHLSGNVRQWIVAGVGGAPDVRKRPEEFAARGSIAKAKLLDDLRRTVEDAKAAIRASDAATIQRPRHVQHGDVTGLDAVFNSVSHFVGHVQEVVHMTRVRRGEAYRFLGIGATSD